MAAWSRPAGPDRGPEIDWLTGLGSRAAFSRQVIQADRDRDHFAIALIEIDDFGQVNQRLDHETGDELLTEIGRGLGCHTSVTTFVARLGGARFAVIAVQPPSAGLRQWIAPLVAAARDAIADWTFELIDCTGDCPVEPMLRAGLAAGRSSQVWSHAATALELAKTDPLGDQVVVHDDQDPRVISLTRQRYRADRITAALTADTLAVATNAIEAIRGPEPGWRWLELGVAEPNRAESTRPGEGEPQLLDRSAMAAGLQRRLDGWLIDRAGMILSSADRQLRLTVPVTGPSLTDRALMQRIVALFERGRIPPSRLLFELSEAVLIDDRGAGRDLARRLNRLGSGLMVSGCTGGWPAWRTLADLPVHYLKPDHGLLRRAVGGDPAATRILRTMADNAASSDRRLLAPATTAADGLLAELGFDYRQSPARATTTDLVR